MTEEQKTQYQTIIQARNFHYEQFTRWSSYFYVVIGALFVGYYVIMNENSTKTQETNVLSWVILGIGYLTSVANFLSVKGYIYWWQHWNIFLTRFEEKFCKEEEEKVYSVFADKQKLDKPCSIFDGCNISTSKVALLLARIIVLGWCILLGYKVWFSFQIGCCCLSFLSIGIPLFLYLTGLYGMPNCCKLHSDISNHTDLCLLKNKK